MCVCVCIVPFYQNSVYTKWKEKSVSKSRVLAHTCQEGTEVEDRSKNQLGLHSKTLTEKEASSNCLSLLREVRQ